FCECSFVDLNVATTHLGQPNQFAFEGFDDVIPELSDVIISVREHGGIAATEVQRTGSRDRDLGKQPRSGFQKIEVGNIDRMRPAHPVFDKCVGCCPRPPPAAPPLASTPATVSMLSSPSCW